MSQFCVVNLGAVRFDSPCVMGEPSSDLSAEAFDGVSAAMRLGAGWAFDRAYRWLAPAVLGFLRAQGVEDPEDLCNEVFLGVFRNVGRFEGNQEGFRSWVFVAAHRRVVDDRRRRARRPVLASVDPSTIGLPSGGDFEREVLSEDAVVALCAELPGDQRDVVLLRLVGDLGLDETARALGKSVGAVKSLQHRALESLRKELHSRNSKKGVSL